MKIFDYNKSLWIQREKIKIHLEIQGLWVHYLQILYDDDGDEHHDNLPTYSCVVAAFSRFRGFQIDDFVSETP